MTTLTTKEEHVQEVERQYKKALMNTRLAAVNELKYSLVLSVLVAAAIVPLKIIK